MRPRMLLGFLVPLLLAGACGSTTAPIVVGAVYPAGGGQGMGGADELRGVRLAAELANAWGGIAGRRIQLRAVRADSSEAAPGAVAGLASDGVPAILGSHGSTISRPAASAASQGVVFWETGAVGELDDRAALGRWVFRFAPAGGSLGRAAVDFVNERLRPLLAKDRPLRYAVAYVDDVYGRAVGLGALAAVEEAGLPLAGAFPYRLGADYGALARRIGEARPDVLVVAAYLEDGIALRRGVLAAGVPLLASIGTSSSYCMPAFGAALGTAAVGLFASDKPDGEVLDPDRLPSEAARGLRWAREQHRRRHGEAMSAEALSGFAGAWALFRHVLPRARSLSPAGIARAARGTRLPLGSLPNGAGLDMAPPDAPDAGANRRAVSVIWEWAAPGVRSVVWPPAFATGPILPIDPEP